MLDSLSGILAFFRTAICFFAFSSLPIPTSFQELDLLVDLEYPEPGGFELALDIDMVFRRSIHLCIRLTSLKGRARIRLTRNPYTHWSFAFVEEPHVAFKVRDESFG